MKCEVRFQKSVDALREWSCGQRLRDEGNDYEGFRFHATIVASMARTVHSSRMNVSVRAMIVALLLVMAAACAPRRDVAARFRGSISSIDTGSIASGDDARWASPQWNDAAWTAAVFYRMPPAGRTFWIHSRVELPPQPSEQVLFVYSSMLASSEVFWDGRLIGRGGTIARDSTAALPGPMDNFFPIPREAAGPGAHLLAIRVAIPKAGNTSNWFQGIVIGDYDQMLRSRIVAQVLPLSGCGVFLVISLYYLAMYLASARRRSMLVFALLCFAATLLAVAETWRWTVGYTYDWHIVRLIVVSVFTFAVAVLLPLYFVCDFQFRKTFVWLLAIATVIAAAGMSRQTFDGSCLAMFAASVGICAVNIAVGARPLRARVIPAVICTIILAASLQAGGYGFSDNAFFFAFCNVILVLLVAMTIDLRRERREHEDTLLRTARLEIALLHKSIQPHFVMNTLTAAMEWIEQSPAEGVKFLEAFADQLRIFADVSGDVSIPMAREIALCRAHLMVMSGRKGVRFLLRTECLDESASVPPAVFHTLLENAITHNRYGQAEVVFALREERQDRLRRYVLDAPLTPGTSTGRNADGIGLRYIKARLEENYPGCWHLESEAHEQSWTTTIEVPA